MKSKKTLSQFNSDQVISISETGKIKGGNETGKGEHFAEMADDNN